MADPTTSTLAVNREIADQVREVAKQAGSSTLDVTNQLLAYALKQAEITVEVKSVKISTKGLHKGDGKAATTAKRK